MGKTIGKWKVAILRWTTAAYAPETTYGGTNSSNTNVAEIDAGSDGIAGTPDDFYLCQSITGLQVGQNYTLCFNYSRRNIGPNPMDMIVTIDGGALTQTFLHTTLTPHYG
jgi:hypothetical protein